MTDQEISPEELQKFWEKSGLTCFERWFYLNGKHIELTEWPALTLDNLFKYAVPKIGSVTTIQLVFGGTGWYCQIGRDGKWIADSKGYHTKPELALFRAIREAIE